MIMSIKNLILLSLTATITLAAPPSGPPFQGSNPWSGPCLSDTDANQIGFLWTQLIGNYTAGKYNVDLANAALADNFTDYSASALSLNANCQQAPGPAPPLGEPVFTNKTIFIQAQGSQVPIASKILAISHTCREVTMRYKLTDAGSGPRPVYSNIVIETVQAPRGNAYPNRISVTYSEFDSAAWVSNLKDSGNCRSPTTETL